MCFVTLFQRSFCEKLHLYKGVFVIHHNFSKESGGASFSPQSSHSSCVMYLTAKFAKTAYAVYLLKLKYGFCCFKNHQISNIAKKPDIYFFSSFALAAYCFAAFTKLTNSGCGFATVLLYSG